MTESPDIVDLGRCAYAPVHARMLATLDAIRAGTSPGEVLLVEHDPVYTAGRATPTDQLRDDVIPVERGGQITYHGPGQLVVYPIVKLPKKDVRAWLRSCEFEAGGRFFGWPGCGGALGWVDRPS